jgi:hypothetical protein
MVCLSDEEFITQFENQTLAPEHFDHCGHLRLAWLYLSRYDRQHAFLKISQGIQSYAASLGDTEKFAVTITDAMSKLVASRQLVTGNVDWLSFLRDNPDLVENSMGLLLQHYRSSTLFSDKARKSLVEPDLKPF